MINNENFNPVHPGEVLLEEFMKLIGLNQNRLTSDIHVPVKRINEILQGKRCRTADTALRLVRFWPDL